MGVPIIVSRDLSGDKMTEGVVKEPLEIVPTHHITVLKVYIGANDRHLQSSLIIPDDLGSPRFITIRSVTRYQRLLIYSMENNSPNL